MRLPALVASLIGERLPWLRVSAPGPETPRLAWRWDALLEAQAAGADPTRPWREALGASTAQQYAVPTPPAMPAAFVLQWVLEVPATVGAYAAVLGPWAADLSAASLSFELAPGQHYPCHVQFRGATRADADRDARLQAARTAYQAIATPFAALYSPGVRLGPHQRHSMVADVWAIAVQRARQSVLQPPAPPVPERDSCCFIYTLPDAHECEGCPRLRRSPGAGLRR